MTAGDESHRRSRSTESAQEPVGVEPVRVGEVLFAEELREVRDRDEVSSEELVLAQREVFQDDSVESLAFLPHIVYDADWMKIL